MSKYGRSIATLGRIGNGRAIAAVGRLLDKQVAAQLSVKPLGLIILEARPEGVITC